MAEQAFGTYHLVPKGETTWHQYAQFVVKKAIEKGCKLKTTPDQILPIATEDYPLPAKRPKNSRLDSSKLKKTFNLTLPPWEYHLDRVIEELLLAEEKK